MLPDVPLIPALDAVIWVVWASVSVTAAVPVPVPVPNVTEAGYVGGVAVPGAPGDVVAGPEKATV